MMENKTSINIILITNSFPYMPGEQFLETEVKYYRDCNMTIMPQNCSDEIRKIDNKNIKTNNYLINNSRINKKDKILYTIQALFSVIFLRECVKEHIYSFGKLKIFLGSMIKYYHYYYLFKNFFLNNSILDNTVIYTYWNTEITYALQTLKEKYDYKIISRIHRYDIYKEERRYSYMPLKKQFTKNIDKIFTITESANEYLHNIYGFDYNVLELGRLGVEDYNIISKPNKKNILHIVSCSFLVEVKQVDKIIKALAIIAKKETKITYIWTHIGDGPLYESLLQYADNLLKDMKNVQYSFQGNLDNEKVYKFYKNNSVDVFVNVSKSEGVPVSIMEAMSCHIPIIAPNIGGISDMVVDKIDGVLLSDKCEINEIVSAFKQEELFKNENIRKNVYNIFYDKYDAKKNYNTFLNAIGKKLQ